MSARSNDEANTLIISEYDFLRKEIATSIEETRRLELMALAATGAIWTWLLSNPPVLVWAWALPPVLIALAAFRAWAISNSFGLVAEYLREKEGSLFANSDDGVSKQCIGWETFRKPRSAGVKVSAYFFWGLLLIGSVAGAILLRSNSHKESSPVVVKVECVQPIQK